MPLPVPVPLEPVSPLQLHPEVQHQHRISLKPTVQVQHRPCAPSHPCKVHHRVLSLAHIPILVVVHPCVHNLTVTRDLQDRVNVRLLMDMIQEGIRGIREMHAVRLEHLIEVHHHQEQGDGSSQPGEGMGDEGNKEGVKEFKAKTASQRIPAWACA